MSLMHVDPADSAIIYYIAGYIAKALLKDKCVECVEGTNGVKIRVDGQY